LPQYAVEDLVHQGHLFRYLRAFDHERGRRVIVKAVNADDLPEATSQACHKALGKEVQILSLGNGDRTPGTATRAHSVCGVARKLPWPVSAS